MNTFAKSFSEFQRILKFDLLGGRYWAAPVCRCAEVWAAVRRADPDRLSRIALVFPKLIYGQRAQSRRSADEPARRARRRSCWASSTPKQVEAVSIEIAKMRHHSAATSRSRSSRSSPTSIPTRYRRRHGRPGSRQDRSSRRRWARTPAARSTTSASRSRPCPSAFCRRSTARTC